MKRLFLTVTSILFFVNLFSQATDNRILQHFLKVDSTFVVVDNTKGRGFMFEIKTDSLFRAPNNWLVYDKRKVMQINVVPFSQMMSNPKEATITELLEGFKKWELNYMQNSLKKELKSGQEIYLRDNNKPFLIWWFKNPPKEKDENSKTVSVTHSLYLNFSIMGERNVAISIPVYEDEILEKEIEKLKEIAHSVKVFGSGVLDIDVLKQIKQSKENYVLRDSLNFLELEVPDWFNVFKPIRNNFFMGTFPEWNEIVNAAVMLWDYPSESLSFSDFAKKVNPLPKEEHPNYKLLEENDSILRYFHTSKDGVFYQQSVYLKSKNIYCFIMFTATKDTYDYNLGRFEEILGKIKLK